MENKDIYPYIDHTLLKATATKEQIKQLCTEAEQYGTASVCIPPAFVKWVRRQFPKLNICTVIGFPLGYNTAEIKAAEAADAVKNGADEIDMVINLGFVKDGMFEQTLEEICAVRKACEGKILKVIIETCYLTEEEKVKLCQIVTESGADFIKTSTGFGTGGATIEDIWLFKTHIGGNVKMKAAGGVKTKADLEMFIEAGCKRIGTSSAVKLLSGKNGDSY